MISNSKVECRPNGLKELSAKVSFSINKEEEGKEEEVFWVPHKGDATDYVTMEEENLTEDLVELRLAEEEFRRAEMVEKVAMVGRKSDKLKVEEEKKLESDFDKLLTAPLHSASSSIHNSLHLISAFLVVLSLLRRGN